MRGESGDSATTTGSSEGSSGGRSQGGGGAAAQSKKSPLVLPPGTNPATPTGGLSNVRTMRDLAKTPDVLTHLSPSPHTLKVQNRPMSELHSATSSAEALPYLSDRNPSTRYLQIDTQVVSFHPVGEIEPLFCTVAIWHVETTTGGSGMGTHQTRTSPHSSLPVPNMQRCGRVTEALHFDFVTDPEVEAKCAPALWPTVSFDDSMLKGEGNSRLKASVSSPRGVGGFSRKPHLFHKDGVPANVADDKRLKGTRCGVFPLPSNFEVGNLHAVIIVHKVLSEETEVEPYLNVLREKRGKNKSKGKDKEESGSFGKVQSPKHTNADLAKLRGKAAKVSERLGRFLMPFAFGVAPLYQVIGSEIPIIPSSRAVQIPLHKLVAGRGEKPIIDHIMVMLHPNVGNQSAEVTKGEAVLTIRNFGFLGLHSVVHTKSKLARDRLVDFTGELQLRRRREDTGLNDDSDTDEEPDDDEGRIYVVPPWKSEFVAEPTVQGGRDVVFTKDDKDGGKNKDREEDKDRTMVLENIAMAQLGHISSRGDGPSLYAQELAPIPLNITAPISQGSSAKISSASLPQGGTVGSISGGGGPGSDAEAYFHTSFCNELLCHPRLLHNCTKRNIVIKIELRELRWSEWIHANLAEPVRFGPSIHNPRRGPFLVKEAYTSCAYHTVDPMFLDEFKVKLPLSLVCADADHNGYGQGRLVVLFTVFNVAVRGKKKWTNRIASRSKKAIPFKKGASVSEEDDTDEDDVVNHKSGGGGGLEQLGCGLLPLTSGSSALPCLLQNGLHDVRLKYFAKLAPPSLDVSLSAGGTRPNSPAPSPTAIHQRNESGTTVSSMFSNSSRVAYPGLTSNGKISFIPGTIILEPLGMATNRQRKNQRTISESTVGRENGSNGDGGGLRFPGATSNRFRTSKFAENSATWADDASMSTFDEMSNADMSETSTKADQFLTRSEGSLGGQSSSGNLESLTSSRIPGVCDSNATIPQAQSPKSKPRSEEVMVLQVRTVAISSVHPQNPVLAKLFLLHPKPPRLVSSKEMASPSGPWRLSRDEILIHADPARAAAVQHQPLRRSRTSSISTLLPPAVLDEEQRLLEPTIALSKSSLCPPAELSSHFVRIVAQLWRTIVTGTGEPSLVWANPASLLPLRLHSFATLLHAYNSVTTLMSKSGTTQLDGRAKISLTTTGRILSMLFDEDALFLSPVGTPIEDVRDVLHFQIFADIDLAKKNKDSSGSLDSFDEPLPKNNGSASKHRQSLSLTDFKKSSSSQADNQLVGMEKTGDKDSVIDGSNPTAQFGEGPSPAKGLSSTIPLKIKQSSSGSSDSGATLKANGKQGDNGNQGTSERKIDTRFSFQNALRKASGSNLDGLSSPSNASSSGAKAALNMIGAFGGTSSGPAGNRRKWMTAPSLALATIREDEHAYEGQSPEGGDKEESVGLGGGKGGDLGSLGPMPNWDLSGSQFSSGFQGGLGSITETNSGYGLSSGSPSMKDKDSIVDTKLVMESAKRGGVKQMRVPRLCPAENTLPAIPLASESKVKEEEKKITKEEKDEAPKQHQKVPQSNDDIKSAGEAFLDVIGKNLGYGATKDMGGEERRVGFAHHRKTRSRCSIDWTLPPTDVLLENEQQFEYIHRHTSMSEQGRSAGESIDHDTVTSASGTDSSSFEMNKKNSDVKSSGGDFSLQGVGRANGLKPLQSEEHPLKRDTGPIKSMADDSVPIEAAILAASQKGYFKLPSFIDRTFLLGKKNKKGRWFPYTYEVVIFQWVALLVEQIKGGDQLKGGSSSSGGTARGHSTDSRLYHPPLSGRDPDVSKCLSDAASRARGVSISSAPLLFEIIKKSLGWRIDCIFRQSKRKLQQQFPSSSSSAVSSDVLPVVSLDSTILSALEELISMVTDACIDSRNFDSWNFRQTSIDVNDAIARFLRDLFALLEPSIVHHLTLIYFSRFVMKEGKHWQDRDSKIGLRCSWETCKLRLNSVSLFIRFSEFFRVNTPLMETWDSWPMSAPPSSTRIFFNDAIRQLESFGMPSFVGSEGPTRMSAVQIPPLKPHWLLELVSDICLTATGHAEQNIQHRASSLLHELFWAQGQKGKIHGNVSIVASMFVPFITKILSHINYLSSLPAKSQLRKDLLPCVVFIMQSAPLGLMRALWRKLCRRAEGKGHSKSFGGIGDSSVTSQLEDINLQPLTTTNSDEGFSSSPEGDGHMPDILDVFCLLNLVLKTFEYEGSEVNMENDNEDSIDDQCATWRREFLFAIEEDGYASVAARPRPFPGFRTTKKEDKKGTAPRYTTSSSRKWHAHDGAIVAINTSRLIVREALFLLRPSADGETAPMSLSPSISLTKQLGDRFVSTTTLKGNSFNSDQSDSNKDAPEGTKIGKKSKEGKALNFTVADTVIFARATTSVYLHSLSLRQSDVVIMQTLVFSEEIVKIFGIKIFLAAVGETLQHWMRVVLFHCGDRRADVRVQALEFLALILRLTWDSFGSFSRVRVPLIAVQIEVMERIVATAATRYYREQRRLQTPVQYLSNDSAEASLAPFWRTLNRLHNQSASHNVAFRSAQMRLAEKMKNLFRAYIAAHALAIVSRFKKPISPAINTADKNRNAAASNFFQNNLVTVHRITEGFSKQFLGSPGTSNHHDAVLQSEAIEDAFLSAADVFTPTELPSLRVAWLGKLAGFHKGRSKFAEEATCRFHIHLTQREAARLHHSLWNSVPFLPWASDSNDGVHLEGDGPAGASGGYDDTDYDSDDLSMVDNFDYHDIDASGKQLDKSQSFRRIFYRVANSVRMRSGDWDVAGNRNLFYGVTNVSEYIAAGPLISLREMEEEMVEETETAGDLYLKAGIVESSRYAWSLATQFYSETFNYARLAYVYRRLARVVASEVPVVDTSNQVELSSALGRFYRVWFHGGAPDELMGAEFVYRAAARVKLEEFGMTLCQVLKTVLPEKTPIDLMLDDGRTEESRQRRPAQRRPLSAAPREPIKIKVTPLRPLLSTERTVRGTPEWFYKQTESSRFSAPSAMHPFSGAIDAAMKADAKGSIRPSGLPHLRSASSRTASSSSSFMSHSRLGEGLISTRRFGASSTIVGGGAEASAMGGSQLVGVEKFSFTQPFDRARGSRDWLKSPSGDFSEKSLRVTQITVEKSFPACVSRQGVVQRTVFSQSPLESGVEAVCSWCAVLFRTAVATNGLAVIGTKTDQGIGTAAAKVVADCIHCSHVKEIGISLLNKNAYEPTEDIDGDGTLVLQYAKLSEGEIWTNQIRLARAIIMFMELLHLLIARNRDLLLAVVQARKRSSGGGTSVCSASVRTGYRGGGYVSSPESVEWRNQPNQPMHLRHTSGKSFYSSYHGDGGNAPNTDVGRHEENYATGSVSVASVGGDRSDSAIAVQSELQRAFIAMARNLYELVHSIVHSETPGWLKSCCQDNYFSSGMYRHTRIAMAEELFFFGATSHNPTSPEDYRPPKTGVPLSIVPTKNGGTPDGSYAGSSTSKSESGWHHKPSPT